MKKLISLLLALVMVLSLAACGGDSKTPDSGSKTPAGNDSSGGTDRKSTRLNSSH